MGKDGRVWHHKERLVVHRCGGLGGEAEESLALKMRNRHYRNLFNGQPRLALADLRSAARNYTFPRNRKYCVRINARERVFIIPSVRSADIF